MGVKMKSLNHKYYKNKKKCSEKGLAVIETIPLIFIFVILVGFTLGFYGITQRMILHSIAARAYGTEQIRNRTNINYLRDISGGQAESYHLTQHRYFAVREPGPGDRFVAAKMNVDYRTRGTAGMSTQEAHNSTAYEQMNRGRRNDRHYFDTVWVKVGHGICLTASCGE